MIQVGTAGYSYVDWKGHFYPDGFRAQDMLGFYAQQFPFVEVNSSYYRMPSPHMLYQMAKKTPAGFEFVIKAFQGLTHDRTAGVAEEFAALRLAVVPLVDEARLGAILLQFPNGFRCNPQNMAYLRRARAELVDLPTVVEFRHNSWLLPEVKQLLQEERLGFVAVDEPHLPGLMPSVPWATAAPAYVRFHGRNAAKWWHHVEAYERYDYTYSATELEAWLPRLRELEAAVGKVYVAMNNHYQGQAPSNALQLMKMLGL